MIEETSTVGEAVTVMVEFKASRREVTLPAARIEAIGPLVGNPVKDEPYNDLPRADVSIEVMFLTKVTVENWTMVKVVGVAVLVKVETEVTVSVDEMVSWIVVGVVLVSVVVVTWTGTKRVD